MRFRVIALLLLAACAPLMAQTEKMSAEQSQQFTKSKLSVDLGIQTAVSAGFGGFLMNSRPLWSARQGFDALTEARFYEIAGFPAESKKAADYKTVGWVLVAGGGALMAGGALWGVLGTSSLDYMDPDYTKKMMTATYVGVALSLLGIVPLNLGLTRLRMNWSSPEQAQMAADQYNAQLAARILSGSAP